MKKIYVAKRIGEWEIIDILVSDSIEDAEYYARRDRNHLTHRERYKCQHFVYAYEVPDCVIDMESFSNLQEQNYCDPYDCWIVYTKEELLNLADNLDWDITNENETLECLRTNWEDKLTENEVMITYDIMCINARNKN